jgi:hypothetical protein
MAAKKLAPRARKLANPGVDVDEANPTVAKGDYETDARGPADRDGNAAQARRRRAPPGGGSERGRNRPKARGAR